MTTLTIQRLIREKACLESRQYLVDHWGYEADLIEVMETILADGYADWCVILIQLFTTKDQFDEYRLDAIKKYDNELQKDEEVYSRLLRDDLNTATKIYLGYSRLLRSSFKKEVIQLGIEFMRNI